MTACNLNWETERCGDWDAVHGPSGGMWKVCPFQTQSNLFWSVGGLARMDVEVEETA